LRRHRQRKSSLPVLEQRKKVLGETMTWYNNKSKKNARLLLFGSLGFAMASLLNVFMENIAYASFMFASAVFLALLGLHLEVKDRVEELRDKLEAMKP